MSLGLGFFVITGAGEPTAECSSTYFFRLGRAIGPKEMYELWQRILACHSIRLHFHRNHNGYQLVNVLEKLNGCEYTVWWSLTWYFQSGHVSLLPDWYWGRIKGRIHFFRMPTFWFTDFCNRPRFDNWYILALASAQGQIPTPLEFPSQSGRVVHVLGTSLPTGRGNIFVALLYKDFFISAAFQIKSNQIEILHNLNRVRIS